MLRTYRNAIDYIHPNEVVTYRRGTGLITPVIRSGITSTVPDVNDFASFTTNVGDHLLVIYSAVPQTSGWKLSSDMTLNTAFADRTAGKQLHVSAHDILLGDNTNSIEPTFGSISMGFEHRCSVAYFDRENQVFRFASSLQDVSDPYDGSVFGGLNATNGSKGTDAGMGSFNLSMSIRRMSELGSVRIIRWAAGKAPPIAVINAALEWTWRSWAVDNRPVLYPGLISWI